MDHIYLSQKEIFWKELLQSSGVDHIYNSWLSEYDSYQHHIHENQNVSDVNIGLEKKSFLRHLTISIFFYLQDDDCAIFISKMLHDQKRNIFTGHFLLYLLEENTVFQSSLLSVIDSSSHSEPAEYLLLHCLMFPTSVSIEYDAVVMSADISTNVLTKLSAVDGLKINNHVNKTFSPKIKSLHALIDVIRHNMPDNKMWINLARDKLIKDITIIQSTHLFESLIQKGLFLDDICQQTSLSLKDACLEYSAQHCTGSNYAIICQLLGMDTQKSCADAILLIYQEVMESIHRGVAPYSIDILRLCQDAMSTKNVASSINQVSNNKAMLLACHYYNISPADALNMSDNTLSSNAALKNIVSE